MLISFRQSKKGVSVKTKWNFVSLIDKLSIFVPIENIELIPSLAEASAAVDLSSSKLGLILFRVSNRLLPNVDQRVAPVSIIIPSNLVAVYLTLAK